MFFVLICIKSPPFTPSSVLPLPYYNNIGPWRWKMARSNLWEAAVGMQVSLLDFSRLYICWHLIFSSSWTIFFLYLFSILWVSFLCFFCILCFFTNGQFSRNVSITDATFCPAQLKQVNICLKTILGTWAVHLYTLTKFWPKKYFWQTK